MALGWRGRDRAWAMRREKGVLRFQKQRKGKGGMPRSQASQSCVNNGAPGTGNLHKSQVAVVRGPWALL